jgi:uncharacterized membrane-anchored protein
MMRRPVILGMFAVVALAQFGLLGWMIVRHETVLRDGHVYKFKTAPVDPYDAFRGRYVALRFEEAQTRAPVAEGIELKGGQTVYTLLGNDPDGFAQIKSLSVAPPPAGDYFRTKVAPWSGSGGQGGFLSLVLPFDSYYMNETLAPAAETAYREHNRRGGDHDAFVTVRVLDGRATIEQLYIGGKPIEEFLRDKSAK